MKKSRVIAFLCILMLGSPLVSAVRFSQDNPPQGIKRLLLQIERVTSGMEGKVGLAATHIESGENITLW